jgi:hypothetical protein
MGESDKQKSKRVIRTRKMGKTRRKKCKKKGKLSNEKKKMQQRHNLKTQCTIEIERDEFVDM